MATKADTMLQAIQGLGCLGKARHDEPVFVLRARDRLSHKKVREWADEAEALGAVEKAREARQVAIDIARWQKVNGSKDPD